MGTTDDVGMRLAVVKFSGTDSSLRYGQYPRTSQQEKKCTYQQIEIVSMQVGYHCAGYSNLSL
jgi:hypothetical protein